MTALFDALPVALREVRTRPLFVMQLAVQALQVVGATPGPHRRVGVVSGGVFEGERLFGQVLPGGNDWQDVRSDGSMTLNVRLVLKTSDDALIGMTYPGIRQGPPEVMARLEKGEIPDPESYYFRIAPLFETAAPQYAWLNDLISIGVGHRIEGGPVYSLFEVL